MNWFLSSSFYSPSLLDEYSVYIPMNVKHSTPLQPTFLRMLASLKSLFYPQYPVMQHIHLWISPPPTKTCFSNRQNLDQHFGHNQRLFPWASARNKTLWKQSVWKQYLPSPCDSGATQTVEVLGWSQKRQQRIPALAQWRVTHQHHSIASRESGVGLEPATSGWGKGRRVREDVHMPTTLSCAHRSP